MPATHELDQLQAENAELREQLEILTWERDALERARDHLTKQAAQPKTNPKNPASEGRRKRKTMDPKTLERRAEVAMWGCLACAQPWIAAGSRWGHAWAAAAAAAWLVARIAGNLDSQTDFVQRAFRWITGAR